MSKSFYKEGHVTIGLHFNDGDTRSLQLVLSKTSQLVTLNTICSVVLVWCHLFFICNHANIYSEVFVMIFDTDDVWDFFFMVFLFLISLDLYVMQELSFLDKIFLVPIWFRMLLAQTITRLYKGSLTLIYPPNITI